VFFLNFATGRMKRSILRRSASLGVDKKNGFSPTNGSDQTMVSGTAMIKIAC
jgi:hypothetical protein